MTKQWTIMELCTGYPERHSRALGGYIFLTITWIGGPLKGRLAKKVFCQ
jgi:hypothetical protein